MAQSVFGDNVKRSVTLYTTLPEEIVVTKDLTGRKEATEIETLAYDILKNGQNTPVLIRKGDKGEPILVYGHRRVLAIRHINKHLLGPKDPKVLVQAKYEKLSDIEAMVAAIGENRFRKDVTSVDDAHNIAVLQKKFKLGVEAIAAIYFPEATSDKAKADAFRWVKDRTSLQELDDDAKAAVREGKLKTTAAVALSKLPKEKQREVIAKGGTGLKGGGVRIKSSDIKAAKAPAKPVAKAPAKVEAPAPAPAVVPAPVAVPAPAPASDGIYEAAEKMARAVDKWLVDITQATQDKLIAAHAEYRKLVPVRPTNAEDQAA